MRLRLVLLVTLTAIELGPPVVFAQSLSSTLIITSPPTNTVVRPGQTVTVLVSRSLDSGITAVALRAFGWTPILSGTDPLQFTLTIPSDAPPGPINVIAVGKTASQTPDSGVFSAPLVLIVASPQITSRHATVPLIRFRFAGAEFPANLSLIGVLPSGKTVRVTNSAAVSFASQDTTIATVDQ